MVHPGRCGIIFAVVFPEQTRSNNANTCFNWFEGDDVTRGEGEVASIRSMVARMQADRAIDPARVFVRPGSPPAVL